MQLKKNPKADLENKKGIFFAIGLILSLSLALYAIEFKSTKTVRDLGDYYTEIIIEDLLIPRTKIEEEVKKKFVAPEKIEKADDDDDTIIEAEIKSLEIDPDEALILEPIEAPTEDIEKVPFAIVEFLPKFEKHRDIEDKNELRALFMNEIMKHVKRNFRYPEIAKEQGIEGRVICEFTIDENGYIKNINVVRAIHKSLDDESVRIIKKIPKLIPAKQRNKAVQVSFYLPITFKLN